MRPLIVLFLLSIVFINSTGAQVTWKNASTEFLRHIPTRSTNTGAMVDINGDLVDDILIMDRGQWAKWVQSSGINFDLRIVDSIQTTQLVEWSLSAGDFDNSGNIEFLTIGNGNNLKRIRAQNEVMTLLQQSLDIYAQASNTVDINNDGWLDYYVCDDLGPNVIFLNDGNGRLVRTEVIDFLLNDPTDGSGNYGSEWVDINGDLLPDLCIAKCSAFATESSDMRRINRVYINKGDGTFTEQASELGLASGEQSWVNAFGDIDNDGDQDVIIINHYSPHQLMENHEGKFFTEIKLESPIYSFGFQAVMRDFDNDGFLDIFVASVEGDMLLHNNGDKTFTPHLLNFGPSKARSFVVGDVNDDGYLDVFAMMADPINNVGKENDQLWLGVANGNNYFKVNLEGRTSNRMGIGAQVEIYGPWGQQTRYVKGGESYGIFNSLQQHFGLNTHSHIDSLIIKWPSGVVDVYKENLEINSTFLAQEGLCMTRQVSLYDQSLIYRNEPLQLQAPDGYNTYLWNEGETTSTIDVVEGDYYVVMNDLSGCKTISKPIHVISGCFSTEKLILSQQEVARCEGDDSPIFASSAESYLWSDGSRESFIVPQSSGWIQLTAQDYCGETRVDSIFVSVRSLQYTLQGDSIQKGERALLKSDKPLTYWYNANEEDLLFVGPIFETEPLEATTVFNAQVLDIVENESGRIGEQLFPTNNLYGHNSTSGDMIFDVLKPCIIKTLRVNTDTDGLRRILITNNKKEVIFSRDYDIKNGISTLELNVLLEANQRYIISTDIEVNRSSLGYRSPRFVRTFNNTSYPYQITENISIIGSSAGPIYYYYFYDWQVDFNLVSCESGLEPVVAFVDRGSSSYDDLTAEEVLVHPNPIRGHLRIQSNQELTKVIIYDRNGHPIFVDDTGQKNSIETHDWPEGLYFIHCFTRSSSNIQKIIKLE